MIATALIGGLGNQMFQYAAGRALALRHGTGLALDLSSFGRNRGEAVSRHFELDRLAIDVLPPSPTRDLRLLLARRPMHALQRLSGWRPLREASLSYDPGIEIAPDATYLLGYWQSWRYIFDHGEQIATELQPRAALPPRSLAAQAEMQSTPSVSLHVRRGDYLHAAHASHPVLDRDFYIEAMQRVRAITPDPVVHIFSDDLDWCRDAFAPLGWNLRFIDWNRGLDSWQDLFLMSACRHAIVANSSFSWWGAWLGDRAGVAHDGRMVVAPRRWFASGDVRAEDRCPPSWTVL